MTVILGIIAVLILASVIYLKKFMRDMAKVESDLINELKEMKTILLKINEKQL